MLKGHNQNEPDTQESLAEGSHAMTSRSRSSGGNHYDSHSPSTNGAESSEDHLKAIIENVVEGIISIDDRGIIESINPAALSIFGYELDELIGQNVSILMPSPDRENHDGYLRNYHETGDAKIISIGREVMGRRKNGEVFPLDLAVGEVNLPHRKLFTGIIRDISERKLAEKQLNQLTRSLQEKNKELESVVYVASHDLRSPLVNIQGFSIELSHLCRELESLLGNEDLSDETRNNLERILGEEIPEALQFIFAGVNKMDGLLAGFLNYSRLGRVKMDIRKHNLNDLLNDVLSAMHYQIQKLDAIVELNHLGFCLADKTQLSQVFTNLLDNALKYSKKDERPVIEISSNLSPDGSSLIVQIKDNGVGIREEHFNKIFDIYFQLSPESAAGEGLGLSIARKVISRMDGKIWVDSEFGRGSLFSIALPIE